MKFSYSATVLALISKALAEDSFQLFVQSDNSEISGKGISSIHEGAGIDYYFLGTNSADFVLNGTTLAVPDNSLPQVFSVDEGIAKLTVTGSTSAFSFSDAGLLQVNGSSDGFYACKNVNDPYKYSTSSYALVYGSEIGTDCISLKLSKSGSASSSSSAPAGSSSIVSSFSSSITTPTSAVNSTLHTVTKSSTETDTISCSKCTSSISTYEAGAEMVKPIGFAAVAFGLAAILI